MHAARASPRTDWPKSILRAARPILAASGGPVSIDAVEAMGCNRAVGLASISTVGGRICRSSIVDFPNIAIRRGEAKTA